MLDIRSRPWQNLDMTYLELLAQEAFELAEEAKWEFYLTGDN